MDGSSGSLWRSAVDHALGTQMILMKLPAGAGEKDEEEEEEEDEEEEEEEDAAGAEEEVEKVATALFPVAYDGIQKSKHLSSASSNSRKRKKIVMIVMIVTVRAAARPVRLVQRPLPQARDASSSIYSQRHRRPRSQLQPAPANPLTLADRREKQQQQQQRKKAKKKQTRRSKEDAREEKPPSNRRPSTRSLVSALKRTLRRASGGQISCLVHISYGVSWPPGQSCPQRLAAN